MLGGVDQVKGQPGRSLVQPLQLVFLCPGVRISAAFFQVLNGAVQAIGDGLINIHRVPGPASVTVGGHQIVEFVALAVGRGDDAQLEAGLADHREKCGPDLATVGMEGEFVQKNVGRKAARRVRISGQGRHAGAVGHAHFQGAHRGAVFQVENVLGSLECRAHSVQMELDAFLHSLTRLPLAARKNDPARAAALHFGGHHVQGDLQSGCEGLADLAAHHADFKAGIVFQPALLVGIKDGAGHHASPR